MKLGYACINTTLKTSFKTCRMATVQKEGIDKVKQITLLNLETVKKTLMWNIAHNIFMYRLSGTIVPFATHDIMPWEWEKDADVLEITNQIKNIKESFGLRLTCHPGQYSPLNTPNEKVLYNAINDFHYHNTLMNLVGGTDIITHVGGMYGDKDTAKLSFIKNYNNLSEDIKKKLRLENDDKTFTVEDVLDISLKCGVPICLDIHHHNCNPSGNIRNLIHDVMKSWDGYGTPKFHISTGKSFKTDRAHADYISIEDFLDFVDILGDYDADIMFESKTKDLSVLNIQKSMLEVEKV